MQETKNLYDACLACGGAVSTDSRRIVPGSLFFALKGPSFDGNAFVVKALEAGAGMAVTDDPALAADAPAELRARILTVSDSLGALQQLAAHHRRELSIPILAITGTNGKTTTKELLARVLARKYKVWATQGNLNNHIGVPLTLLSMDRTVEFGIVEMGASACGEIALLCAIAQPGYGLITNIGLAHLEGFGDLNGVERGKGELYDYLAARGGRAFYRAEDPALARMIHQRRGLQAEPYGAAKGDLPNRLEGDYNRANIAAAVAVGEYFGVPDEAIREAVAGYVPDNNRSQTLVTAHNRLTVDCYNANPSSMKAALENFTRTPAEPYASRTVIVGDMLELGRWSAHQHVSMIRVMCQLGLAEVYLVGPHFREAADNFRRAGREYPESPPQGTAGADKNAIRCAVDANAPHREVIPYLFDTVEELAEWLDEHPLRDRAVLIKGSRGIRLERILPLL